MASIQKTQVALALILASMLGNVYGHADNSLACEGNSICSPYQPTCWGKGFISADLLYLRAFESGLDNCIASETFDCITSEGNVISHFKGKSRNPHFRWDPGYRVGIGFTPYCSNWGIAAFWTHFHTHANSSKHRSGSSSDVSCFSSYESCSYQRDYSYESCSSSYDRDFSNHEHELKWKLNLDVIDLLVGYDCDFNSCMHLRPFVGARWANIDQSIRPGKFSDSCFSLCSSDYSFVNNRKKQDFSGVGPLIGLEADWKIGCGFSFYISGAVSWLYGKFNVNLHDSRVFSHAEDHCSVKKHLDANVAAEDASIGIRWQTCICGSKQLYLQLGLEHHRYYDFNRIGECGDLSFDGGNFSVAMEF